MPENPELVISTFLDGEQVETADVLEALEMDAGRAALADFVRLRLIASQPEATPDPEFYARMRGVAPVIRSRAHTPRLWLAAAAAAASLAIGFWTGVAIDSSRPAESTPPKVVRVVQFEPGVDWHQAPPEEKLR